VSPIYRSQAKNDPTIAEMIRLDVTPGSVRRQIKGVDLTEQEYDQLTFTAGRLTKAGLDALRHWKGWDGLTDEAKRELMGDAMRKARDMARDFTVSKFPDLALRIKGAKQEKQRAILGVAAQ